MSTEEEEEDEEAIEERARVEGDIDKVKIKCWPLFHFCQKKVPNRSFLMLYKFLFLPFCEYLVEQVLKLVHELKAKDIEEYRKKIVERDKNKDEDKDIADERRMVVNREMEKGKGERSKFDGKEESEKTKEGGIGIGFHTEDELDQSEVDQCVPSPAAVFTFDQEDIQTSKLQSFEKV